MRAGVGQEPRSMAHTYSPLKPCAQEWAKNAMAGRASKADKLGTVDHSKIDYPPFRRSFYIETQELAKMKEEEVAAYRKELDDIKVGAFGKDGQAFVAHILKRGQLQLGIC